MRSKELKFKILLRRRYWTHIRDVSSGKLFEIKTVVPLDPLINPYAFWVNAQGADYANHSDAVDADLGAQVMLRSLSRLTPSASQA